MILACEQHVDWIADCVRYMRDRGFSRVEAEQAAEDAWVRHNNEVADRTLYPLANSWYVGAISRESHACSCRMSVASPHTRRNAMRLPATVTKAFLLPRRGTSSGSRRIEHIA